jgi:hypothetical protein
MLCPHCEHSGTMTITTAVVVTPIYTSALLRGSKIRLMSDATAMLSCRNCAWRVAGRLYDATVDGSILTGGAFAPDDDPVVPPAHQ